MPSRTPFSFSPSSSSSASASSSAASSFIPYSSFPSLLQREPLNSSNVQYPTTATTTTTTSTATTTSTVFSTSATVTTSFLDQAGLAHNSLGSSLSSSRDEQDHVSYTPIYPSYSSSFSNSSLELHESLLLAIRERQIQQQQQQRISSAGQRDRYNEMTPIAPAAAVLPVAPYQMSAALPFESSETIDAALERRLQQQQQQQQQQSTSVGGEGRSSLPRQEEPSGPRIFTGLSDNETRDNTDPNADILAIQLDDLTIETIPPSSQSAISLPSASPTSNSTPESLSIGVTVQRMGLAQNVRDQDRDRMQLSVDDLDSERTTRSSPSALLLAQPLSLALDEDQSQPHFLSSDPTLTPLRQLRASTPLSLEHSQDYPVFAHDRAQHQAQYSHTISNTMDYASDIPTITSAAITNSINNTNHTNHTNHTNSTNNNSTIQASINSNRIGQDVAINEHISEPTHSYQSSIFTTMEPQEPYPADTRLALTQVLTSFQGAIIDHAFDHFAPQAADTIRMGSNSIPLADSMSTFTDDTQSATAPTHMLAPSEIPSLGTDESRDMSNGNLSTFPRAALPRRRYATRDYSTGSISSDDWLHHPDVVAFNTQDTTQGTSSSTAVDDTPLNSSNFVALPITTSATAETPFAPAEVRLQPSLAVHLDQGETPVQREQVADSVLDRAAASMTADSLSSAAAEAIISSTLTDSTNVAQESQSVGLPASIEIDGQATQPGPTLHSTLEPLRADRLDLLGPLLSGTQNAPLLPPNDESPGFSLLSSSGRRIQGFDSSILSMASRIRQARLARILRLMSERDPPMAYPDRYQWGRFAPTDTRSMVNHASISRGTSRAGSSVEENQADQNLESESRDLTEDGRVAMRHRDAVTSSRAQSSQYPAFTEILDCNGNPLDSSNESYASSSSASSMTSYDALEDRDEDMDWLSGTERRRRRRTGWDDPGWNRGAVRGQGRSRVVSTGTAFEGLEYISQADNLLNENGRYRSLKASWMTNPNGESWSDDEGDDPQRRHQGQDHEDKDPENISMRRDPPSLGMLPSHNESSSAGGLYYIYGNVRNRYGPDSVRRRRVVSDMTVLLRREQEWERELEQYDREMAEFQMGGFNNSNTHITREDASVPRISMIASTPSAAATTLGSSVANAGTDGRRASSNDGSISGTAVSSDIDGGGAPTLTQSSGSFGSVWPHSNTDIAAESSSRPPREFRDYEQGHSHYHAQGEMANEQDRQGTNGQRRDRPLLELHRQYLLQHTHSQQQQQQQQPTPSQSITHQSTVMNRTPPLLPAQPLVNEPIAHQIRRAHNSHIMGLQRRWEMQQQQQQQQQQQLEQAYLTHSVSGDREQDRFQRYPGTTFVPPPSRQQPQNHPNQSLISTSSTVSSLHVAVPMSRGSRSSFRTSHETNGFQHFNLTGNGSASQSHPSSSSSSSTSQYLFTAPPPPVSSSISSSGSTLVTFPLGPSASLNTSATTSTADANMFSSSLDGRITGRSGVSSVNRADPATHSTEQLGTTIGPSILPSGVMLPASRYMQSGIESSGVSGQINSTAMHLIPSSSSSSSSQSGIGSLFSASLSGTTASTIALSSSSLDPTEQQQQQSSSSSSSSSSLQSQQFYRRTRWRGSNTLYVNYEGGTLKPEEQWRRGDEERVGR